MTSPVAGYDRIDSLDVLRGVAVLGILIMNIQSFAMYSTVYFNPVYHGMLDGAGHWVWYFSHLLADQKFMTIFSLLFGAGIVLFTSRKETQNVPPAGFHYRRMRYLALFGLLHAYLIWDGDVLFLYGVCGLLVYLLRRIRPVKLIVIGLLVLGVGSSLSLLSGWSMQFWPQEQIENMTAQSWLPPPEKLAEMTAAFTGGYGKQFVYRAPNALFWQTFILLFWGIWRAGGLMVLGMGLYKLGVFSAGRSRRFYLVLSALALVVGVPLILLGVNQNEAHEWNIKFSFFKGVQYNYWGSLFVSGGWIGLTMLACKTDALKRATRPLAAVGRMAFSNYIGQSIICSLIFYGHGLGYYNQIDRVGQLLIVVSIWVLQLIVSPIWLSRFHFGPLEWVWRSLSYKKRQPFRV